MDNGTNTPPIKQEYPDEASLISNFEVKMECTDDDLVESVKEENIELEDHKIKTEEFTDDIPEEDDIKTETYEEPSIKWERGDEEKFENDPLEINNTKEKKYSKSSNLELSRKDVFFMVKDSLKNEQKFVIDVLKDAIFKTIGHVIQVDEDEKSLGLLFANFRSRWRAANRGHEKFLKNNEEWLKGTVQFSTSTSDKIVKNCQRKKKIGVKGLLIGRQGREIINNVIRFMQKEAESEVIIPLSQFRKRVLAATGISQSTSQKVASEGSKRLCSPSTSFSSPSKKRRRKSPVFDKITPELIEGIKTIIYEIYIVEKKRPTLKCIYEKVRDSQLDFNGKLTSLSKLLKWMGFRCRNKKVLMEKFEIRLKRIEFLKQIMAYRAENRYIVYADETYISHMESKGQCLIVQAGGENGFVPHALLILKSDSKNGDYHDFTLNHANFMKWVEAQLIPNLPERSVLVVDNASYHNITVEKKNKLCQPRGRYEDVAV